MSLSLSLRQIEWRIPDHLMLVEKRSASGNGTVNSTLTLAYNTASSHLHGPSSPRQPLLCLAQNDRYVSVEEIDISEWSTSRETFH